MTSSEQVKNYLYGDGIHDDYPAIQELLDSGVSSVVLPEPEKFYIISQTLKLPSNMSLKLERFTQIRLADNSNCLMLQNSDYEKGNTNICVDGGIWDMNHANQWPNPFHFPNPEGKKWGDYAAEKGFNPKTSKAFSDFYAGVAMRFCRVKNFIVKNITVKNPVNFGIQAAYAEQFTFENIIFDYTEGSPKLWNMDGIHLEGFCKYGVIRNLQGACHDDLVAITADDGLVGPIESILVDGIYAENNCHSAVRLLSNKSLIKNVRITNVFGSFYAYCVGITNYSQGQSPENTGFYENIVIDNVFASVSQGTVDVMAGNFSPIHIDYNLKIRNLRISGLYRDEKNFAVPTIHIDQNTNIRQLILSDVRQTNTTGKPMPLINNNGMVERLILDAVDSGGEEMITGEGNILNHGKNS